MPKKSVKKSSPKKVDKVSSDLPGSVKIGYRDIEIEYVSPDFKTDNLTDCYGEYRAREGKILLQHSYADRKWQMFCCMNACMEFPTHLGSTKLMVH